MSNLPGQDTIVNAPTPILAGVTVLFAALLFFPDPIPFVDEIVSVVYGPGWIMELVGRFT